MKQHSKIHQLVLGIIALLIILGNIEIICAQPVETNPYMGAPITLTKAPNGAITNKKLLDRVGDFNWLEPTIENPVKGIWVFGGYGLAPMSIIEAEDGLIAFDTGDTRHDGELMLEAIRTINKKPIKVIIYGHSHTVAGAGVLAEGNKDIMVIGHPNLNEVVKQNLGGGGAAGVLS